LSAIDTPREAGDSVFWGPGKSPAQLENDPTVRVLKTEHPSAVIGVEDFRGDLSITVKPEDLLLVAQTLKIHSELRYDVLMDVCGVDYLLADRKPRLHSVYHFYSIPLGKRVRVHVPLDDAKPAVDSLTPLYKSANWGEREAYDMYGIEFKGHPNLKRILMPDDYASFPLRKDYPLRGRGERDNFVVLKRGQKEMDA